MKYIADFWVLIVAILHFYFLILEMFLWTQPWGLKVFKQSLSQAKSTAVLAANQGLYNGFLSAGLFWGFVHSEPSFAYQIKFFFLSCVIVAGIYGAATAKKNILFIQALPALVALFFVWMAKSS